MGKKPTDWTDDIWTDLDFMAAEERRKDDLIRGLLEAELKSIKFPEHRWPDIIEKALKELKSN